ncbi:MAG: GGDEF domain-containing protein [Rhodospirillales bacterium]|nr:GGDEF domain-containing protein [Alphaproteobacteria bacterium]USO04045.1 MAG: GGDEF domain-containing protein [Rhodospirillales bacterium]
MQDKPSKGISTTFHDAGTGGLLSWLKRMAGKPAETKSVFARALSDHLGQNPEDSRKLIEAILSELEQHAEIEKGLQRTLKDAREESRTDPLTEIGDRRALQEAYEQEVESQKRGKSSGGQLILLDLDHFKWVNDTLGHDTGDKVLKFAIFALANTLTLRRNDELFRIGGDEFVVLLPDTKFMDLAVVVNRINDVSSRLAFEHKTEKHQYIVPVRFSAGVASVKQNTTLEAALKAADRRMYEKKNSDPDRPGAGQPSRALKVLSLEL